MARIPITVGSIVKATLKTHGTVVGTVTALNGGRSVTIQTVDGRTVTDTILGVYDEPLTLDEQVELFSRTWRTWPKADVAPRFIALMWRLVRAEQERYIRHGVPHPQGTRAWLREYIDELCGPQHAMGDAVVAWVEAWCPMCRERRPWEACPICTLTMCDRCQQSHDLNRSVRGSNSLCTLTARAAEVHATMRSDSGEPVLPELEDWHWAHVVMASSRGPGK